MTDIAGRTTGTHPVRSRTRTLPLLLAGAVTAVVASALVAVIVGAVAAPGFPALQPLVFVPFVVIGFAAAAAGWALVRRLSPRPASLLRVLVPALTVLSLIPDAMLAVTRFIPGATLAGALALATMHLIVVAVSVVVLSRALPVRDRV